MDIKLLSFFLAFFCSSFLQVTFAACREKVCSLWPEDVELDDILQRYPTSRDICQPFFRLDLLHPNSCYRPINASWTANVAFIEKPEDTTGDGSPHQFQCVSQPPALFTYWYFNGRSVSDQSSGINITPDKRIMTVAHTGPTFLGKYTCEVVTEQGVAQTSAWIRGADGRACTLDFLVKPENIVIELNFHGVLKCKGRSSVGGHTLKWYKLANNGAREEINGKNAFVLYDDLLFVRAKRAQQGTYVCEIEDSTGCNKSAEANVTVYRNITQICGTRPVVDNLNSSEFQTEEKIKKGRDAAPGSAPWLASIWRNGKHVCGGVVLNRYWVATAAHCFVPDPRSQTQSPKSAILKFGLDSSTYSNQTRLYQRRIIHPYFERLYTRCGRPNIISKYDIALLKLKKPLQFNDYVRPICLPYGEKELPSKLLTGMYGHIVGRGVTHDDNLHAKMHEAEVPLKSNIDPKCICMNDLQMLFCAGAGYQNDADACRGDSGGPFAIAVNKTDGIKWYLAGLVSSGPKCTPRASRNPMSGVYTNVTYVQDWILETIRDPRKRFSY